MVTAAPPPPPLLTADVTSRTGGGAEPNPAPKSGAAMWLPEGLDPAARDLVIAAREPSTVRRYERHVEKWLAYCAKERPGREPVDPQNPSPIQVANWLTFEVNSRDLGISAVKERRAALAEFLRLRRKDGTPVPTDHRIVADVVRGLNKRKPVRARYEHAVFDISLLERELNTLGPNHELPLDMLWGKLIAWCETCGLRLGDTYKIRPNTVVLDDEEHTVEFTTLLKQTHQLKLTPKKLGGVGSVGCIHCTFAELLSRRPKTADKSCLFVFPKGKAASKDWLAKCVRKVMDRAGIPAMFKAHSIRHAASSAMVRTEGLAETLRVFGWSGP